MKENYKKLKQFFIKNDQIFFIVIFLIILSGSSFYTISTTCDEGWNLQNIYKMYNGLKIYVDANVITTPLFHCIGVIIFKIIGANFFTFRIYSVFINLFLFFGIYKIFKSLNIKRMLSLLFTIVLFILEITTVRSLANYNTLALVFCIYGILVIINRNNYSTNRFIIVQSIITMLVFLTKQNIGLFYLIGLICYNFIFEEKKNKIKNLIKIFIILFLLIINFIIILYKEGLLTGFISYAILGINEFVNENLKIDFFNFAKLCIITILNIVFIIFINKKNVINETEKININKLSCFVLPFFLIAYPIFNWTHINMALLLQYIIDMYILYFLIKEIEMNTSIIEVIITLLLVIILSITTTYIILFLNSGNFDCGYDNIYFGYIFRENEKENIEKVIEYIKNSEKRTIMLTWDAPQYLMPLKINNGNLDEPLLGNLGKDGEDGVIKKISELKNTNIFIKVKKEDMIYQESNKIIDYVKNQFDYVGELESFSIYTTKNN